MTVRGPRGSQLLAWWLALILVAAGTLAIHAFRAQRSHRLAAEHVLADYAHLAATRLVERLEIRLGAYTCFTLAGLAVSLDASDAGSQVDPRELHPPGARGQEALATVATIRRVSLAQASTGSAADDSSFVRVLAPIFQDRTPDATDWGAVLREGDCFAYRIFRDDAERTARAWVFVFDRDSLGTALQGIAGVAPLLPAFLLHGVEDPRWLHWSIETSDGLALASSADVGDLTGEFAARDTTSRVLDGMVVRAKLDPDAAATLVSGGVPGTNLPQTLVLFVLSCALLFAAWLQMRREAATARLREDFVASVSHELRTPLAQIRLFIETLRLGRTRSDEERERALEIVDRESLRLMHLVHNVLLASRAGRGVLTAERRDTDLGALVHEVAASFRWLAATRKAHLTVDVPMELHATVDAELVRQALINLLDNAVKYGPIGQTVSLSGVSAGDVARLCVDDEGPGIPGADRARVWERFQRLERHHGAGVAGSGLGLAVVRDIVRLHGGTVAIEDSPRGSGTRVELTLPLEAESPT